MVVGNNNVSQGRRDGLMIMRELLENMQQPARLTHVLYKTNLSYAQIKKYLDLLSQMELIKEVREPHLCFQITEKGRLFVQILESRPRKGERGDVKMSTVLERVT